MYRNRLSHPAVLAAAALALGACQSVTGPTDPTAGALGNRVESSVGDDARTEGAAASRLTADQVAKVRAALKAASRRPSRRDIGPSYGLYAN